MIKINPELRKRLLSAGVSTLWQHEFNLPDDCVFEAPCSIKWMGIEHSLRLGAFSYAVSGYFFACRIGRYTSIGEQVQIGRGNHPSSWFSSSPVFYGDFGGIFNGVDRRSIDNLDFEQLDKEPFTHREPASVVKPVIIGNDVWIGHGAFVKPGVHIGDGAIVGAHTVVTRDVPPYAIVVGNPGRIVRYRFSAELIERLLALRWWNYTLDSLRGIPLDDVPGSIDILAARIETGQAIPFSPKPIKLDEFAAAT